MFRKIFLIIAFILFLYLLIIDDIASFGLSGDLQKEPLAKQTQISPTTCFECHEEIGELYTGSKHSKQNCNSCHSNLQKHIENASEKPVTNLEITNCGKCHKDQYDSYMHVNLESKAKVEKSTTTSRSPAFDKLMVPHAFTKEHAEPRSHVFMLVDMLTVDRAFGGRFYFKDWKQIIEPKKAWEILADRELQTNIQKNFLSQTATAANPTCFSCKTSDHVLNWKYKGEPSDDAIWSRTSNVVEMARNTHQPMGCIHCHDPHSTQPRIIRDALIEAIVDRNEGTYPYNREKSELISVRKISFRDFRAIGILNKKDSNILCAQCHVEYNCNPGIDTKNGSAVTKVDPRTNIFPWVNVFDYNKKMEDFNFKDFKHSTTGALLSKIQHPETEVYWESTHEKAGVECKDCHMPKLKKGGKTYTYHGQKSARYMTKETCLSCHKYWTEKEAEYQIDAVQNYIRGKIRKAENWLARFIDTFQRAKDLGVSDSILNSARKYHTDAHTLWEWWTAENSDGFHNPEQARKSLTLSIDYSQEGIKILEEAINKK